MLDAVATLVTRRAWWIALGAAALAAVALAFGAGVARSLAPFGFDDPATESVGAPVSAGQFLFDYFHQPRR